MNGMARVAILTASDKGASGERADASGDAVEARLRAVGHHVVARITVPDEREVIGRTLADWCDSAVAEIVITTGGTGLTARDITPEATRDIAERDVPGIPVALWMEGWKKTPYAVLSRGIAVTRGQTLIVNLPGNPKAVEEGMDVLLPLFDHIATLLVGTVEHRTDSDTGHASARGHN
jgi:molybdenum cofactor synthesis domain-containing protein